MKTEHGKVFLSLKSTSTQTSMVAGSVDPLLVATKEFAPMHRLGTCVRVTLPSGPYRSNKCYTEVRCGENTNRVQTPCHSTLAVILDAAT